MAKLIAFLRFRRDITREEAIRYYEGNHVPLMTGLMPGVREYIRNYLEEPLADFDVVTELWFDDRESLDHAMATIFAPGTAERVAEDELNFLDRSASCSTVVDEVGGPVG